METRSMAKKNKLIITDNFADNAIPFEYRTKIRNCKVRLNRINTQNVILESEKV